MERKEVHAKRRIMKSDYKYLRAWCMMMGSFPEWVEAQVERAKRENAPETAVYRNNDGRWVTFDEVKSHTARQRVYVIVQSLK